MRFIIDDQLPPALAQFLRSQGHQAQHTDEVGLRGRPDHEVWRFAEVQQAIIISKDADFVALHRFKPDGPCVIWIRSGNVRKHALLNLFASVFPAIVSYLESGEKLIEVR